MITARSAFLGVILALLILVALAGCWAYALDYEGNPAPAYQPGIELDVDSDRSKTRPPLKQTAPKPVPAPKKVKS